MHYTMVTIGWPMLLLVLIIGLRLGGVSLGLLSGLALGLLTFSVQPTAPPHDLMILQATWLLLMATLEAAGFFYLLETKLKACIEQLNNHYGLWVALFSYGLVFLTGDKKWLHRLICDQNVLHRDKARLLILIGIAAHMALLTSPLSISGILLIIVVGNSGLSIVNLVGTIVAITVSITTACSLLAYLMPDKWLIKLYEWFKKCTQDDTETLTPSAGKVPFIFLLLPLTGMLFLLIKPEVNGLTRLSGKIFPVKFPIFFALVMLSTGAVATLGFKIKPARILQTHRFKVGLQQFFISLGLTWLLDSLINHDKAYLIKMLYDGKTDYGFYLVATLYLLLIDIPIIIWLFTGLLIEQHCTIVTLALWLVVMHSLTPVRYWINSIMQAYKKNSSV